MNLPRRNAELLMIPSLKFQSFSGGIKLTTAVLMRKKLKKYADELNQGSFREHREKITVNNIRTWFKNKRQNGGAANATTGDDSTSGNGNQPETTE